MRRPYVFAVMQLTRFRPVRRRAVSFSFLGLRHKSERFLHATMADCKHCFRRTHAYCTGCGENVGTERITGLICSRKSGGCVSFAIIMGSAARRGKGISGAHPKGICFAAPQPT